IAQAGDRHRAVEGPASGREAAGAEGGEDVEADGTKGCARRRQRAEAQATVRQAVAGGTARAAARAQVFGIAPGTRFAGTPRRNEAEPGRAARSGEGGGPDEGARQAPRGRAQGGPHARALPVARRGAFT